MVLTTRCLAGGAPQPGALHKDGYIATDLNGPKARGDGRHSASVCPDSVVGSQARNHQSINEHPAAGGVSLIPSDVLSVSIVSDRAGRLKGTEVYVVV